MELWARFKRLFSRQPTRLIFRYWDGESERAADPIVIYRALDSHPEFNLESHLDLAFSKDGDPESERLLVAAVKSAFGVKDFRDCGLGRTVGLTEVECMQLCHDFFVWMGDVKKNGRVQPTSPEPTGPEHSNSAEPTLDTNASSACGSTPSALSIERVSECTTP